jgi:hypothetical protein
LESDLDLKTALLAQCAAQVSHGVFKTRCSAPGAFQLLRRVSGGCGGCCIIIYGGSTPGVFLLLRLVSGSGGCYHGCCHESSGQKSMYGQISTSCYLNGLSDYPSNFLLFSHFFFCRVQGAWRAGDVHNCARSGSQWRLRARGSQTKLYSVAWNARQRPNRYHARRRALPLHILYRK